MLVVPGANCYWSAGLTWSQSATPNGCNAWLLPEDIFKTDRICTPWPILFRFAILYPRRYKFFFGTSWQVARMKVWFVFLKNDGEKWCAMCYVSPVSTPGPRETHLYPTIWCLECAGGLWILLLIFLQRIALSMSSRLKLPFLEWLMLRHKN